MAAYDDGTMARKNATILRIFVASPSDVNEERAAVEQVVTELNHLWSKTLGVFLEVVRWETHAYPGVGVDSQDVINQEVGDEYDIFLGMMWARFGTATSRSDSGTAEEFERAFSRFSANPTNLQILFYFKDAPLPPSQFDAIQLGKVQEFKKKLGTRGTLYWEYTTTEEFVQLVRIHVSRCVQAYGSTWGTDVSVDERAAIIPTLDVSSGVQTVSVGALDSDEEELGFIELIEEGNEGIEAMTRTLARVTQSLGSFGMRIAERKTALDELRESDTVGVARIKKAGNWIAEDLDHLTKLLEADLPQFGSEYAHGIDAYTRAFSMLELGESERGGAAIALESVRSFGQVMENGLATTTSFRDMIASLPRATTALNRAKKHLLAALDELGGQLATIVNLTSELHKTITTYTEPPFSGLLAEHQ